MQRPNAHNLPAQATSFVGRNEELAQLTALLAHTDRRLITVIGPGASANPVGAASGTTRRCRLFGAVSGRCFFVAGRCRFGRFLPTAVADALGLTLSGRNTPGREVAAYLRRRRNLLLVLDNLEPLQQDDRLIDWLDATARCARCEIAGYVTRGAQYRRRVDGRFERVAYPASAETQPVETLHYDAVALFVQRVRQLNNAFALTAQTPACTVRICQSVNGIPLALELGRLDQAAFLLRNCV